MRKRLENKARCGFLLADALLGLTVMALVVTVATQTMRNIQLWVKQADRNKGLADEAERMWLEIQLGGSLGPSRSEKIHEWSITPWAGPYGLMFLKFSTETGDDFYVASPQ